MLCSIEKPHCVGLYAHIVCGGQVLDDELCYKYSEYQNIYEVYATRARMFRNVYLHKCAIRLKACSISPFLPRGWH